jgi:hypothetical protein
MSRILKNKRIEWSKMTNNGPRNTTQKINWAPQIPDVVGLVLFKSFLCGILWIIVPLFVIFIFGRFYCRQNQAKCCYKRY